MFWSDYNETSRSWLITGLVTRLTRRMSLVEQELLTRPEHLSSPPVFCRVFVTQSLVLCVCFVDRCLSFCPFSFCHYVVCPSSICRFWLPFWYLQTLLNLLTKWYYIWICFLLHFCILNVQKDSLAYKWNLFGYTFTSYESILSLFFLPFCLWILITSSLCY